MVIRVEVRKRNESAYEVIRDVVNGDFVRRTADMSAPETNIIINNRDGVYTQKFSRNDYLRIYDHEELIFDGKVFETRKNEVSQQLTVIGWKKEYLDLKDTFCMEAEQQNGYSAWNWGSEEMLNGGNPTLETEGLRPDEIFLAGLGLTTEIQHFFTETDAILLTETNTSLQTSGFSNRDTQKSLEISHLTETSYNATGTIVTKTLTNGLVGFNTSPDVSTVRVRLSGEESADTNTEVRVSIDDGVTWSSYVSPVYISSTGLWADATFSNIANDGTKNLVKVEIKLTTNGGATSTPRVRYMRVTMTHPVSDTGITAGTIDVYTDPDTDNDTSGGDYNKRTRLDVVQGAVKSTVAPAGEQYTHWIAFIDENGAAHFRNPATYHNTESGVILSREAGTCNDVDVTTVGQIINNIVYVGTGVGGGTLVITESDAFAAGILRNAASIAQFGEIQGLVTEKNVFSIAHADKRARSIARLLSQEQKAVNVPLNPNDDFDVDIGQKVRVQSAKLDTDLVVRILEESFDFDATGLRQRHFVLGNNIPSVNTVLAALRRGMESHNLTDQGSKSPPSVSFHDNLDKDHPADLAFYIPEDERIRRIGIHLRTSPFRTFSTVSDEESAHTHGMQHTHQVPGSSHTHPINSTATSANTPTNGVYLYPIVSSYDPVVIDEFPKIFENTFASVNPASYEGFILAFSIVSRSANYDWEAWMSIKTNKGEVKIDSDFIARFSSGYQHVRTMFLPSSAMLQAGITSITGIIAKIWYTTGSKNLYISEYSIRTIPLHTHGINSMATATTTPTTTTSDPSSESTTAAGSAHAHGQNHAIYEFDEDGSGKIWPTGIQIYIKDYPSPGDNPNQGSLTVPFDRFGTRGRNDQSIEVQNMDLSVAFRNVNGTFKTGFQQVWVKTSADAPNNPLGLGRLDAFLYIEQQPVIER